MTRRLFLAGLALVGFGRRVWAQLAPPTPSIRYAGLAKPVSIPLETVATPWEPVPFVAEVTTPRRILISGVLFRTNTRLSALCVTCPHEQCHVELVTDGARLARMVAGTPAHPLFECGCHFSVFDAAADGARISGEAPRGLYRFGIAPHREGTVDITEIEEAALSDV